MKKRIAVIGDGGWGTTVAILLRNKGYEVTLWGAFGDYVEILKKKRINHKFLPGIEIPKDIRITSESGDLPGDAICVIAVPSKHLRETLKKLKGKLGKKIVSLTKGIETDSLKRPSEVIEDILGERDVCALSGPSISFEVARNFPTTVVAGSKDASLARETQETFSTAFFRVYASTDLKGVELGGALKNIIAIAAGISDGLGFGANTKAAILTRGLVEIVRLGVEQGADRETFFGLSGLGDLATTCMSSYSRNRTLGEKIGKGEKPEDIVKNTEMVAEGFTTAKSAYELSKKHGTEMPITESVYRVLYEGRDPRGAVRELMSRPLKTEGIR